jgi:membrane protease YdiL (CAAX protease family)
MMMVSFGHLIHGIFTMMGPDAEHLSLTDGQLRDRLINETMVVEGIDALIVVAGIFIAGRPWRWRPAGNVPLTWALAAPGFVLLLGFNLVYHLTFKTLIEASAPPDGSAPDEQVQQVIDITLGNGMWAWAILLICIQPALIEELFFRYLLLGHLRSHLTLHAAVWVSAVIFGMAHLGNPFGWPVLICLGAGLGYARVYSGGMTLPIALHFLHNFAVLLIGELGH